MSSFLSKLVLEQYSSDELAQLANEYPDDERNAEILKIIADRRDYARGEMDRTIEELGKRAQIIIDDIKAKNKKD